MQVPQKLIDAYKNGAFGLFVGAGLSSASGLPNWNGFLTELIIKSNNDGLFNDSKKDELLKLINDPSNYLLVAEEIREIIGADLSKFIKQRFDARSIRPSEIHKKLVQLRYKFIITTNYDTLIEKAFIDVFHDKDNTLTYKDAAAINYNIYNNEQFILKAHGDAQRTPDAIILTEKDYRNIIYREKGYQSILHVLFSTCNILFLGSSLSDPDLRLLLGFIHNIFHGGSPTHFALMDKTKITGTEETRWRKDFNIQILPYDPKNNHEEVNIFIDDLLKVT